MTSKTAREDTYGPKGTLTRRSLLGGAVGAGASLLLGAGAVPSAASSRSSSAPRVLEKAIGFSQPYTSASIWQPLMAGAAQVAAKEGFLLLESHADSQVSRQTAELKQWTSDGVAAIIVQALENHSVAPVLARARAAGIRVVDYSDASLTHADGWVIFDNAQGARLLGSYAGGWATKTLQAPPQVALMTDNNSLTGLQRIQGFLRALKLAVPGARVVAQADAVLATQTKAPAAGMLASHPDINIFVCVSDDGCTGVLEAFLASHPTAQRQQEMFICGFEGSAPVIEDILAATPIRATAAFDAVAVGRTCAEVAIRAIEGRTAGLRNTVDYTLIDAHTQAAARALLRQLRA